jgi:hypothetical protein
MISQSFCYPQMTVGFKAQKTQLSTTFAQMEYRLARYALNGTWLGFESLATQLMYCTYSVPFTDKGAGTSRSTRWLQFGTNVREEYECDLANLLGLETVFYDLYVVDQVKRGAGRDERRALVPERLDLLEKRV